MKKVILILLCCVMMVTMSSCNIKSGNDDLHIFGEWSVSKEATELEDGQEIRVCSHCGACETRIVYAKGTDGLSFTLLEDGTSYSVSAGSATEGDVFIPPYHNGLPVTSIGTIGIDDATESVEIGEYAFWGCEKLKNVVIPPTVTIIGDGAFMLCKSLESIVIPESVKEIGEFAFALTEEEFPLSYYHSDIKVSIPDAQVILILREFSSFSSWGVEIYYLDENGNEVLIEKVQFDDSSLSPFSEGDFEVINNNDSTFSVRAGKHEGREGWWIEKRFDIPQCVSTFVPKAEDTIAVFYGGNNSEAWDKINIASGNTRLAKDNITLKRSVIYFYSETEPIEANKSWHCVDGIPTLWWFEILID